MTDCAQRHLKFGWLTLLVFLSLGIALEAMHGTNLHREVGRRLRQWHRCTCKLAALQLRGRYLAARLAHQRRGDILDRWRVLAAAQQHARRSQLLSGMRELLQGFG